MKPSDWREPAADYEGEVLSVYHHDRAGLIKATIRRFAAPRGSAIDLGCGVGHFTRLLADAFGEVHACDYSADMLAATRERCGALANATFGRTDLRRSRPDVKPADFVLCINVLLSPTLADREAMWPNLAAAVKRGGHIALVVPSLESGLFARHRLVEWNLRTGATAKRALLESFGNADSAGHEIARDGVLDAGGMPTKHYLREELTTTAARFGLAVQEIEKIEYPWSSEFNSPPRWMRAPFPWDWLVLLQKP